MVNFVGIGIANKDLQDPVLGEDSYSYALQIHQHTKIICNDTRNKIQMIRSKSEAEGMIIGIHVDSNEKWMDAYCHGESEFSEILILNISYLNSMLNFRILYLLSLLISISLMLIIFKNRYVRNCWPIAAFR